jgi:hypothetical protein
MCSVCMCSGAELRHPHIVSTLKYVVIHPESHRPSAGLAEVRGQGCSSPPVVNCMLPTYFIVLAYFIPLATAFIEQSTILVTLLLLMH